MEGKIEVEREREIERERERKRERESTDLTESVGVEVLLKTAARVPEHSGVRVVPQNPQALPLHCAPGQGVDGPTGAVVHRDGGPAGPGGCCLPGEDTHEVDTEVHGDNVGHAVSLDEGGPQDALPCPGQHPGGRVEVVHPACNTILIGPAPTLLRSHWSRASE